MNRATRFGAGAFALAAACGITVLIPSLASGGARTSVGSGKQAATVYVASLSGANEVPAADPDGEGAAAVTIDPVTGEICVDLRATNIQTAVMAHIHRGAAGVNGPVIVPFPVLPNPTAAECVTAAPLSLAAEIVANPAGFYVNVHTADFPNGAIRGQLAVSPTTSGTTQLLNEPLRAYDSRTAPDGKLTAGSTRVISLATGLDAAGNPHLAVPPGATGALLRVTITDAEGAGFLKVYSNALATPPATSSVNWYETGAIVGADPTVAVDATSKIKITAMINATHVVIDVVGYVF
jgi:hypothetical protein